MSAFPSLMGMIHVFGQHVEAHDIAIVALLVVLEGVLSIDNALVLGILAKRLPKHQQKRALTYGLLGAFVFRFIAIALAAYLLHWWIVKLFGGAYLVYISVKHFLFEAKDPHADKVTVGPDKEPQLVHAESGEPLDDREQEEELDKRASVPIPKKYPGFWSTVFVIEVTDIAFAVDSILAAIALIGSAPSDHTGLHPKFWVVFTGGFLGVITMRFAAILFIKLLEAFPRFEVAAYLLVMLIGAKLLGDWGFNRPPDPKPEGWHPPLDFHSPNNWGFWVFWVLMALFFCVGFLPKKSGKPQAEPST